MGVDAPCGGNDGYSPTPTHPPILPPTEVWLTGNTLSLPSSCSLNLKKRNKTSEKQNQADDHILASGNPSLPRSCSVNSTHVKRNDKLRGVTLGWLVASHTSFPFVLIRVKVLNIKPFLYITNLSIHLCFSFPLRCLYSLSLQQSSYFHYYGSSFSHTHFLFLLSPVLIYTSYFSFFI